MAGKDPSAAIGVVKVQPFYVIPHKDGKAELVFGDPVNQTCVHSLFPHLGYSTCWYLNRKNQNPTMMVALPFASWVSRR